MFPIHSFRLRLFRSLGFDALFKDFLHDSKEQMAFLVPPSIFEKKSPGIIAFLTHVIESYGYLCVTAEWRLQATYENDHYGSRFRTHVLGPHIFLEVAEGPSPPPGGEAGPVLPFDVSWTVVEISCDNLRDKDSRIAYYTYYYKAALPDEVDGVEDELIKEARAYMSRP